MAGNQRPWRDIPADIEWDTIINFAEPAMPRVRPLPKPLPQPVRGRQGGGQSFDHLTLSIQAYNAIAKDDSAQFAARATRLDHIALLAEHRVNEYRRVNIPGVKGGAGKQLGNDPLDVWIASVGRRASKKSDYLNTMALWHQTAKAKYRDRTQISIYLRGLAEGGHVKDAGEKLHATPYATIEKFDPYHRQTFVFPDPLNQGGDQSMNEMGHAFIQYLNGLTHPESTNANPSFYEWLEYHPICIGVPGILGEDRYQKVRRVSYDGLDLTRVRVTPGKLEAEQVVSAPGVWTDLDTHALRQSRKGPPGGAAFVWDSDCNLYLYPHGLDGFVHASAKQGRKIRCSGMLVATGGKVDILTNESGHYAPTAQSLYSFAQWLINKSCITHKTQVEIEHDADINGNMTISAFMAAGRTKVWPVFGAGIYPQ